MKNYISIIAFLTLYFQPLFSQEIDWKKMNPSLFDQAQKEKKILFLNLEANWCHWCHVMEDSTYSNPEVQAYLSKHFIPVKADQDANPALSNRYKDFGWPANIFINAKGEDVVKRAGYIAPTDFLRLLKAIVDDPSPEEKIAKNAAFDPLSSLAENELFQKMSRQFANSLDYQVGGFDQAQKFIEYASFEHALFQKDAKLKAWTKTSIEGAKQLSDSIWGGIYQYSTHYNWTTHHYEKLLSIQARYMELFILSALHQNNDNTMKFATSTYAFANRFLKQKNGLFSNAQDADLIQGQHAEAYFGLNDQERLQRGIPKIDTNTFTDKNAEMAKAILRYSLVSPNSDDLTQATQMYVELKKRKNKQGLYAHTAAESQLFSLRDQVALAELLVQFIKFVPQKLEYQEDLKSLLTAIQIHYQDNQGGFRSFSGENGLYPHPINEENVRIARVFNWTGKVLGEQNFVKIAEKNYAYLTSEQVSANYYAEPFLLELRTEIHSTPKEFVFLKLDNSDELYRNAQAMAPFFSTFQCYTRATLPKEKRILFEDFNQNTLLVCATNYCSAPIFNTASLRSYF